jgi:hypothetical protein
MIIRTMMYPDVSFSTCPYKRYDTSTNPEEVVQSGTSFAPPPFDYPMQTQGFRNTSWSLDRILCHLADQWGLGQPTGSVNATMA